jgi:hypothetical protein
MQVSGTLSTLTILCATEIRRICSYSEQNVVLLYCCGMCGDGSHLWTGRAEFLHLIDWKVDLVCGPMRLR